MWVSRLAKNPDYIASSKHLRAFSCSSPPSIPPICALSAKRAGFSLLRPAGSSFLLLEVLAFHFRSPVNYRSFGFGGYALSHIGGLDASSWTGTHAPVFSTAFRLT